MNELTRMVEGAEVDGRLGKCVEAVTKGNAEEHWDFCKLKEHPSGRISLCEHTGGMPCEYFKSEEDL